MDCIENKTFDSERALYGSRNLKVSKCAFDGPADGESALKECRNISAESCFFNLRYPFWHAKDVVVRDSVVKGEYLAWYSENVTFENCRIIGTQPFCYCKNLKLVNCEMVDTDLCFEKSDVQATIVTPVISIKNPYSGYIELPCSDEIIMDDENAKAVICERNKCKCCCA